MEWEFLFSQQYINGVLVCLSMPSLQTHGQEGGFSRKGLLLTYSFFSFWPSHGLLVTVPFGPKPFFPHVLAAPSLFPFLLSVPLCLSLWKGRRKISASSGKKEDFFIIQTDRERERLVFPNPFSSLNFENMKKIMAGMFVR